MSKLDLTGLTYVQDAWLSLTSGFTCFDVGAGNPSGFECQPLTGPRDFFTARVDTRDGGGAEDLIQKGFDLIDIALTLVSLPGLDHELSGGAPVGDIIADAATEDDLDAVEGIASSAFHYSRFHRDPRFPPTVADRIKRAWARNLVMGQRGAGCLVGRRAGRIVSFLGYLQSESPRPVFVIDLVAVAAEEQGRGIGRATLAAMQAMAARDGRPIIVGTQVTNVASVRMYEAMGFRLKSSAYILHGHSFISETS